MLAEKLFTLLAANEMLPLSAPVRKYREAGLSSGIIQMAEKGRSMRTDLSARELHWQLSRFVLCSFCEDDFIQTRMSFADCLIPVEPTSRT